MGNSGRVPKPSRDLAEIGNRQRRGPTTGGASERRHRRSRVDVGAFRRARVGRQGGRRRHQPEHRTAGSTVPAARRRPSQGDCHRALSKAAPFSDRRRAGPDQRDRPQDGPPAAPAPGCRRPDHCDGLPDRSDGPWSAGGFETGATRSPDERHALSATATIDPRVPPDWPRPPGRTPLSRPLPRSALSYRGGGCFSGGLGRSLGGSSGGEGVACSGIRNESASVLS
jgi:hypothetical protein